jgi:hypothetical protein
MRRRLLILPLLVLALIGLAGLVSGCGDEETTSVQEGEPLELGDVAYNIQITRELNRFSTEDAAYLQGAPHLRRGQEYLGVFMQVTNQGDEAAVVPDPIRIVDTRGNTYELARYSNDWTLDPGTPIEPGETVPSAETVAKNGPVEGSLILFVIDEEANENRPLTLEIPGPDEVGEIVLDL